MTDAKSDGVIRDATADDIAAVHAVRVETWRYAYAGIVPDDVLRGMDADDQDAIASQRARFRQPVPRTDLLVAERDGRVVGFAAVGPERGTTQPGAPPRLDTEVGEVYAIYVLPSVQGRGIGRELMRESLDRLRAHGFRRATLWVLEANVPARAFYERVGMAPTGERQPVTIGVALPELRYAIDFL